MFIAIPTTVRTDHAVSRARRCVARKYRHLINLAASPRFATHASLEVSDYFAARTTPQSWSARSRPR